MRLLILRTVLVATDLEPSSRDALDSAHRLAKLAGAALHVVHVADRSPAASGSVANAVRAELRSVNIPEGDAQLHVVGGAPEEVIAALADRLAADVIVVGAHRRERAGAAGQPLGTTARAIARHAHAPILIAGQALRLPLHRVLVPTDFSDTARGALLVGLSWASGLRAGAGEATTLSALHVQPPGDGSSRTGSSPTLDQELEMLQRDAGNWAGVTVQGDTEQADDAARVIGHHAAEHAADLVVIGTRGKGADDEARLGSVSEAVAMHGRVPTLLVPPAVWRVHAEAH